MLIRRLHPLIIAAFLFPATVTVSAKDPDVFAKYRSYLYHSDAHKRTIGVIELLRLEKDARAYRELEGVLKRGKPVEVVLAILSVIEERKNGRFLESVLPLQLSSDARVVGRAARFFYARRDSAPVFQALIKLLRDAGREPGLRCMAARALGATKILRAVPVLIERIAAHGRAPAGNQLGKEVVAALEAITGEWFGGDVASWKRWWTTHKDLSREEILERLLARVRQQHDDRLKRVGDDVTKLIDVKNLTSLEAGLRIEIRQVQEFSARHLGESGAVKAVDSLLAALETTRHIKVSTAIARALGKLAAARGEPPLRALLVKTLGERNPFHNPGFTDDQEDLLVEAIVALGAVKSEASVPLMGKMLFDRSNPEKVLVSCIEALGAIRNHEARNFLVLVGDKDDRTPIARAVAEQLGKLADRKGVPVLVQLVGHADSSVRWYAADSLGRVGDRKGVPALIKALADPSARVRNAVCEALGKLGDASGARPLERALADKDWQVRRSAAQALGKIGDASSLAALVAALADPAPEAASEALAAVEKVASRGGDLLLKAARLAFKQGINPSAAVRLYSLALRKPPPAEDLNLIRYEAAISAMRAGRFKNALEELRVLRPALKGDAGSRLTVVAAQCLVGLDRSPKGSKEALAELDSLPAAVPDDVYWDAALLRGSILLQLRAVTAASSLLGSLDTRRSATNDQKRQLGALRKQAALALDAERRRKERIEKEVRTILRSGLTPAVAASRILARRGVGELVRIVLGDKTMTGAGMRVIGKLARTDFGFGRARTASDRDRALVALRAWWQANRNKFR